MIKKSQKVVAAPRLVGVEVNPGPDSGQKLSEEQRWAIINEWKTEKRGTRSIARKLNISRTSVQKVIHKYQATGDIQNIAGQGRKRKCSNADINSIRKKAKAGKSAIVGTIWWYSCPQKIAHLVSAVIGYCNRMVIQSIQRRCRLSCWMRSPLIGLRTIPLTALTLT
jgi:hypothetical protein